MPIVEYPFPWFSPRSPQRPLSPVEIVDPHTQQSVKGVGVLDTGATLCVFPFEHAGAMGISLEASDKFHLESGGHERDAHEYTVAIRVFVVVQPKRGGIYTAPAPVLELARVRAAFVRGLEYPILGVEDFLDTYVLTVNYQRQQFSIRVPLEEGACRICHPADVVR